MLLLVFLTLRLCLSLQLETEETSHLNRIVGECLNNTDVSTCLEHGAKTHLVMREDYYWNPVKRIRKECRSLAKDDLSQLFDAINALKNDKSLKPNVYDNFADIHNGKNLKSVHMGPNFFGWHRIYILRFEELLRRINKNVSLCFWESPTEFKFRNRNPKNVLMFTNEFFGNGHGNVVGGPFANWTTISGKPLHRKLGQHWEGRLISPMEIRAVLSKHRHSQITEPHANFGTNFELLHNLVHLYVGGQMGNLDTSSQDPFFWFHHAYVDSVWEKFCRQIRMRGNRPRDDYVIVKKKPLHDPNRRMTGLAPFRNIDGYSDYFTRHVYEYQEHASCPGCFDSPYLKCVKDQCVGLKSINKDKIVPEVDRVSSINAKSGPEHDITILTMNTSNSGWVFIPIEVVFENSFDDTIKNETHVKCPIQVENDSYWCTEASAKVTAFGLSYEGLFTNYLFADLSIPQWMYSFVAVKPSEDGGVKFYITVADNLDRPCRSYLRIEETGKYLREDGIVTFDDIKKLTHFNTIDDAKESDFEYDPLQEEWTDTRIHLMFRCN